MYKNAVKLLFLIILSSFAPICYSQIANTSGHVTIVSDESRQTNPQIRTSLNLSGNGFNTNGIESIDGSASIFFSNRQISDFSYTFQPNPNAQGWIQIGGLTCPTGYYSNPNSPESTRLDISVNDFYIPKFYSTQKKLTVVSPFTMTGRISCFGSNTDNNPPYGTLLIAGSGNARFIFTRDPNSIFTGPSRKSLLLLTVQYEFTNNEATKYK